MITEEGIQKLLNDVYRSENRIKEFEEKYDTQTLQKLKKENLINISKDKVKVTNKGKAKYHISIEDKSDLPFFTDGDNPKFVPLWMAENLMQDYHFAHTRKARNSMFTRMVSTSRRGKR